MLNTTILQTETAPEARTRATHFHRSIISGRPQWAIYASTSGFIAQLWISHPKARRTAIEMDANSLEDLRARLPRGLRCYSRCDLPDLVEVWA